MGRGSVETLKILVFGFLLVGQVLSKPANDQWSREEDYAGDEENEDYDDGDDVDKDDAKPVSPPVMKSISVSQHIRAGESAKFPCVIENSASCNTKWSKDDRILFFSTIDVSNEPDRFKLLPDYSLAIFNATVEDSSNNYTCSCEVLNEPTQVVVHRLLVDENSGRPDTELKVLPSAKVEIYHGKNVTLGCEARTPLTSKIVWSREGKRLYPDRETETGSYLDINNASRKHAGHYQCLGNTRRLDDQVGGIKVIVHYPPEIEVKNKIVYTRIGQQSEIKCIVHAHPHAKVTWYKDGTEVHHRTSSNKTQRYLTIPYTTESDLGDYKCKAINELGEDISGNIQLSAAPSKPVFDIHGSKQSHDTRAKWKFLSHSDVEEAEMQYRMKGEEEWKIMQPEIKKIEDNTYTIEAPIHNFLPESFEARVRTRNGYTWSPYSEPEWFEGSYASEQPESVRASATRPLAGLMGAVIVSSIVFFRL